MNLPSQQAGGQQFATVEGALTKTCTYPYCSPKLQPYEPRMKKIEEIAQDVIQNPVVPAVVPAVVPEAKVK